MAHPNVETASACRWKRSMNEYTIRNRNRPHIVVSTCKHWIVPVEGADEWNVTQSTHFVDWLTPRRRNMIFDLTEIRVISHGVQYKRFFFTPIHLTANCLSAVLTMKRTACRMPHAIATFTSFEWNGKSAKNTTRCKWWLANCRQWNNDGRREMGPKLAVRSEKTSHLQCTHSIDAPYQLSCSQNNWCKCHTVTQLCRWKL